MKKLNFRLIFSIVIMWGVFTSSVALAQEGDPPPPPGGHGSGSNQPPGGGAPVGDGLIFLIASCSAWGWVKMSKGNKFRELNNGKNEESFE